MTETMTPPPAITPMSRVERAVHRRRLLAGIPYPNYFHRAVRVRDMEATRRFYEDVIGLPLVGAAAFDHDHATGEPTHYIHTFFALGDGSYLAFFQFADERYPYVERTPSYMDHHGITAKDERTVTDLIDKVKGLGLKHIVVPDPVCLSIYIVDPDGDFFEVAYPREDCADTLEQLNAHELLADWMAAFGDKQSVVPRARAA